MYACGSGAQRGQVSDLIGSCELPDMDIRNQIWVLALNFSISQHWDYRCVTGSAGFLFLHTSYCTEGGNG